MMCYRDMTFCTGGGCANFDTCSRALTQEVKDGAEKIGLPIARFTEPTKLECFVIGAEKGRPETTDNLHDADPNCDHRVVDAPGGGIKCVNCRGWFCF
jgi:hypothetical protein